jgi:hypothetical protein
MLRVIPFDDRTGRVDTFIPAGNGAVLCRKENDRRLPGLYSEGILKLKTVPVGAAGGAPFIGGGMVTTSGTIAPAES